MPPSPPACAARSPLRPSGTRRKHPTRANGVWKGCIAVRATEQAYSSAAHAMRRSLMDPEPRPVPTPEGDNATPHDPTLPVSDPQWRALLEGTSGSFGSRRRFFRLIPSSPRCKMCAAPFAGLGAPVMRVFDRSPWAKNPTICGFCFKALERERGGAEIDLTLLFADIRGSTGLGESMGAVSFHRLMGRFYREMTRVLVANDAVVDKFVGDEVVALFIPALAGPDHAGRAVTTAREMLKATGHGD